MDHRHTRHCRFCRCQTARLCKKNVTGLQIKRHLSGKSQNLYPGLFTKLFFQLLFRLAVASADHKNFFLSCAFQKLFYKLGKISGPHTSSGCQKISAFRIKPQLLPCLFSACIPPAALSHRNPKSQKLLRRNPPSDTGLF